MGLSVLCSAVHRHKPISDQDNAILVVDDDEDNLLLMVYALESLGYTAISATTGIDAVKQAVSQSPILILLDIVLPDINGFMVLEQLRYQPLTRLIPVIAITALAHKDDQQQLLSAGFNAYLAKAYMLDEFNRVLRYFL